MNSAIHFRSAVALSGAFPLLAGIDLEVESQTLALIEGSNGAGKTSLLRAIAGLVRIVAGQAEVLGIDLLQNPQKVRDKVALLAHQGGFYDDLSPKDNLLFVTRCFNKPHQNVEKVLEKVGLTGRLSSTRSQQLSTGQRRRLALGALLIKDPTIWLLDEPYAGFDAGGKQMVDHLVQEALDNDKTVVMSSHDDIAASVDQRIKVAGGATVINLGQDQNVA